jgi:hypothetical protein
LGEGSREKQEDRGQPGLHSKTRLKTNTEQTKNRNHKNTTEKAFSFSMEVVLDTFFFFFFCESNLKNKECVVGPCDPSYSGRRDGRMWFEASLAKRVSETLSQKKKRYARCDGSRLQS